MDTRLGLGLWFVLSLPLLFSSAAESKCSRGCDLALASYYVWQGANLTFVGQVLNSNLIQAPNFDSILAYNKQISNKDSVPAGTRVKVPFPCDCINGDFLAHVFTYQVQPGNTYDIIADTYYANLTTIPWLEKFNSYNPNNIPDTGTLNVTVNCSCGDRAVSGEYGLFVTYPLLPEDSLESLASSSNVTQELLQRYNPGVDFSKGTGLVYIPTKDETGSYRPLKRKRKVKEATLLPTASQELSPHIGPAPRSNSDKNVESTGSQGLTGITVDKSVEFSYEELAKATDDFSLANKIGEGGFGSVYYAELRGEKAAIKKMDMQASKEFFAELKVLTHVHHLNLVRLIGYCVEGSLFLVYEYIENGNLSQHLRGSGKDPLPWSTRVQIALDSARGLEYIHEHTVPVYIHRDIKSANILIDKNFRAKVADFGLTKLTEVGSASIPTRLVGTFGYMPPEYAQYGDVSPKVDVYAFGVVLYELISAKEAIVKSNGNNAESRGLVALFEDVLNQPDPREDLRKLVDPRLEENYPLDSVRKMAQLAKACTQENPQLRPSMRSIVVALMTLSSSTEDWDVGSFYENQALVNLMSGR
ncbi:Chitin elicitor receptor kinase 1 [Turnera subulata]|uniref:non-specific serine/threonine protein kinase n=1 Tax=Turnera subulata TaxID=218843 RepID=A0A9Q0FHT3_9ROSI|nr:Chitin elicitor receptor kinase 1 [Turnera subulata]